VIRPFHEELRQLAPVTALDRVGFALGFIAAMVRGTWMAGRKALETLLQVGP